jgi:hypothetical protein
LHASSTPSAFDLNQDQILKKYKLLNDESPNLRWKTHTSLFF